MNWSHARITACALSIFMTATAPSFAEPAASQPIDNGADVVIKVTIQVPEDRMVIPERVSEYTHGRQQLLPALEEALMGKRAGERAHLDLEAERAFGPYDTSKKVSVPRAQVPSDAQVGDLAKTPEGIPFTVVELSDGSAVIDFNHPLAGKRVVLDVTVMQVRPRS